MRRRISIVAMMIVLAVFIYQYFFQAPKKVKKGTVAVDEFLPKDKKKN